MSGNSLRCSISAENCCSPYHNDAKVSSTSVWFVCYTLPSTVALFSASNQRRRCWRLLAIHPSWRFVIHFFSIQLCKDEKLLEGFFSQCTTSITGGDFSEYCTWKVVKLWVSRLPKNANRGCMVLRKVWKLEWNWKHLWTYTAATFHIVPVEHRTLLGCRFAQCPVQYHGLALIFTYKSTFRRILKLENSPNFHAKLNPTAFMARVKSV